MFTPAVRTSICRTTTDSDLASAQIRKEKQKVKSDEIIKACRGATKVSKDDWLEWLRRYSRMFYCSIYPSPAAILASINLYHALWMSSIVNVLARNSQK